MAGKDNFLELLDVLLVKWRQSEEVDMTDGREANQVVVAGGGPTGLM
jgi:hypothetical protein